MTGIDILMTVVVLVLLLFGERLWAWHQRIEYRKLQRIAHRNMIRQIGGIR